MGEPAHNEAPPFELAELYREHKNFVYQTLARFGVAEADRGDQMQEVFLVVHRRLNRYRHEGKVGSWLYGIARRVAAAYRRRAHRFREEIQAEPHAGEVAPDSPEANVERARARVQLEAILDSMTLDQRAVFVMYEIDDLTGQEIADLIGAPLQTVFSRLRRARNHFDKHVRRIQTTEQRMAS